MESSAQLDGILVAARALGIPFLLALAGARWSASWSVRAWVHRARLGTAAAALCAVVAGYAAMNHEQWQFPPRQALDWLPLLAALAALVLATFELRGAGRQEWLGAQLALIVLASWFMLPPAYREGDAARLAWAVMPAGALWLAVWRYLDSDAAGSRRSALVLALSAGALGFVVALGGSIVIGCSAVSLMGALAGWLLATLKAGMPLPRAVLGMATLLFGSVALAAYWYAELPLPLLAACSGGLLLARWLPSPRDGRHWRALALGAAATSPPLLAAIGASVWNYLHAAYAY